MNRAATPPGGDNTRDKTPLKIRQMITTLPLALVQLHPGEDAASNRRAAEAWMEQAMDPPEGNPRPRLLMLP